MLNFDQMSSSDVIQIQKLYYLIDHKSQKIHHLTKLKKYILNFES